MSQCFEVRFATAPLLYAPDVLHEWLYNGTVAQLQVQLASGGRDIAR